MTKLSKHSSSQHVLYDIINTKSYIEQMYVAVKALMNFTHGLTYKI